MHGTPKLASSNIVRSHPQRDALNTSTCFSVIFIGSGSYGVGGWVGSTKISLSKCYKRRHISCCMHGLLHSGICRHGWVYTGWDSYRRARSTLSPFFRHANIHTALPSTLWATAHLQLPQQGRETNKL